MKIVKQSVELLWITPEAENQIEQVGRTCYKSEDRITEDSHGPFCRKMVDNGHHAMIEHASASFLIITDRGVSHEIVRHRIASFAQESTRYCNYSADKFGGEIAVVEPPGLGEGRKSSYYDVEEPRDIWKSACSFAEMQYRKLLGKGCSPQIARSVLPTCLKTEIVMTANFREWRHFITLRRAKAAHPQIREIAEYVLSVLKIQAPNVFYDL